MRWHVTYTVAMGKHGNQRVATVFQGTRDQFGAHLDKVAANGAGLFTDWATRKSFPIKNILLIEWSESK